MSKLRAKSFPLAPATPFLSGTLTARCQNVWISLFTHLYEADRGAETFDLMLWEIRHDGSVRVTPRSSDVVEVTRPEKVPEALFRIDGIGREIASADSGAPRDRTHDQFWRWVEWAIVDAFLSEKVDIEYSYFNVEGRPFSVQVTPRDVGLKTSDLRLLVSDFGGLEGDEVRRKQECLSQGQSFRPRRRSESRRSENRVLKTKKKPAAPRPQTPTLNTFAAGWKRYYFDDGQTRRFWYVRIRGQQQTVVQGRIGTSGSARTTSFDSPKQARQHAEKLRQKKRSDGFIEYSPDAIKYGRKNRRAIKLIRQAIEEYESSQGCRIAPEYRRYILAVNGGSPDPDWITLPGHPVYEKAKVGRILGFKPGQMVDDIAYHSKITALPVGHVPLASERNLFTVDSLGAVHFWDEERLERGDTADDHTVHYDRIESFLVASSLDEFLTRLAKFPNDTRLEVEYQTPEERREQVGRRIAEAKRLAEAKPLRRFFYDDGKLRKYWYIDLQGKSHTTRYARFGSRPGETKKTFDSEQEAAKSAAQLIRQKLKKGYQEIVPEMLSIERPPGRKAATESAIQKFESNLGVELPGEYRRFLKTHNGGQTDPGFVEIPGIRSIDNVDVGTLFGLYPKEHPGESLSWAIRVNGPAVPKGHLPIAHGNDIFTIALERNRGCVYFWDHESDAVCESSGKFARSAGHLLAHSFDEFLTRIALFPRRTGQAVR